MKQIRYGTRDEDSWLEYIQKRLKTLNWDRKEKRQKVRAEK